MAEPTGDTTAKNPYEGLWARWAKANDWQSNLHKQAAHKALDIPEDMGDINAPKTMTSYNGLGVRELAIIGAMALGGLYLFNKDATPPATPPVVAQPAPPQQAEPPDSEYEVRFYDKDGNLITVPRLPSELRQ